MSEGHFERLEAAECTRLLREQTIGRVAFTGPDGPTVLPLAYALDGDHLLCRTSAGTQLSDLPDDTLVAFEVDEFDADAANGWSVLVRGRLNHLTPGELSGEVAVPQPFVPGVRRVLIGITLDQVSGRAVSAAQPAD